MYVGDLGTIDVERGDGHSAGDVVPITHDVLFRRTHGKGTALDENKSRTDVLFLFLWHAEACHILVIVVPSGDGGLLILLAKRASVLAGNENRSDRKNEKKAFQVRKLHVAGFVL